MKTCPLSGSALFGFSATLPVGAAALAGGCIAFAGAGTTGLGFFSAFGAAFAGAAGAAFAGAAGAGFAAVGFLMVLLVVVFATVFKVFRTVFTGLAAVRATALDAFPAALERPALGAVFCEAGFAAFVVFFTGFIAFFAGFVGGLVRFGAAAGFLAVAFFVRLGAVALLVVELFAMMLAPAQRTDPIRGRTGSVRQGPHVPYLWLWSGVLNILKRECHSARDSGACQKTANFWHFITKLAQNKADTNPLRASAASPAARVTQPPVPARRIRLRHPGA